MGFLDEVKKDFGTATKAKVMVPVMPARPQRYEYDVLELREKLLDHNGSAPSDKLRNVLNDRAREGWQFKALVAAEVSGMITKRDGWMAILEREVG